MRCMGPSRVTRRKTTPASNDGSYAPSGFGQAADPRWSNNGTLSSQPVLDEYPELQEVADAIKRKGGEGYLVGGVPRDMALGKTDFSDLDIASKLTPTQFKDAIKNLTAKKGWTLTDHGEAHGTIMVAIRREDGTIVEIEHTTFRDEVYDPDSRKPEEVHFVENVEEDLVRRDFTMNSVALPLDPTQPPVDPSNGLEDLRNGILRTPGDPDVTFRDDPLRMIRAMRFAARDGYEIDPATQVAIRNNAPRLKIVASERVRTELVKLSKAGPKAAVAAVGLARELGIEDEAFGGLGNSMPDDLDPSMVDRTKWPIPENQRNGPAPKKNPTPEEQKAEKKAAQARAKFPQPEAHHEALGVLAATATNDGQLLTADQLYKLMEGRKWTNADKKWAGATIAATFIADRLVGTPDNPGTWQNDTAVRKAIRKSGAAMLIYGIRVAALRAHRNSARTDSASAPSPVDSILAEERVLELSRGPSGRPLELETLPAGGSEAAAAGFRGPAIAAAVQRVEDAFVVNPKITREEAIEAIGKPE